MVQLHEDDAFQEHKMDRAADYYYTKFQPQMEALQKYSPLSVIRRVGSADYVALGEQLEQFQRYTQFLSETGTLADLGVLPRIALDIITATYGASVVPLLASVQPIEEELGTIYYKATRATMNQCDPQNPCRGWAPPPDGTPLRGNVSQGQIFRTGAPRPPEVYPRSYAGERQVVQMGVTVAAVVPNTYAYTCVNVPVRPRTVKIDTVLDVAGPTPQIAIHAEDDGNGNIMGNHCWGTVVYTGAGAGVITLELSPAPLVGGFPIMLEYGTDFEESGVIPQINMTTQSTDIKAEIFVLGSEVGMFKMYAMKKRFGKIAEEEMVNDLTQEITAEIGNELLWRIVDHNWIDWDPYIGPPPPPIPAGCNSVYWNRQNPAGFPYSEHKLELKSRLFFLDGLIRTNAGRGMANIFFAGDNACSIIADLPGFIGQNMGAVGPSVFGTLDGKPIIRAPQPWIDPNHVYAVYKGTGRFDACAVYAPFMPLWVVGTLQTPNNVLKKSGVAAVWAGMKCVAPEFVARVIIREA